MISYWPYHQAVVRAEGRYIKIFGPGGAVVPAERCAQMDVLLDAGNFTTPRILRQSSQADVIAFSAIPGPTLNELGRVEAAVCDEAFARAWEKWSRAWVAELNGSHGPAARGVLDSLPLRSAEWEAAKVCRRVDDWLRHNENVPELSSQRAVLRAAVEQVAMNLIRTAPDPVVWAHGDLYDKQIIVPDGDIAPGLLDFDSTARHEAARDLAGLDVHLELHLRNNRMTPARYLTAHTQVLAVAEELRVSPARFDAYSDAIGSVWHFRRYLAASLWPSASSRNGPKGTEALEAASPASPWHVLPVRRSLRCKSDRMIATLDSAPRESEQ